MNPKMPNPGRQSPQRRFRQHVLAIHCHRRYGQRAKSSAFDHHREGGDDVVLQCLTSAPSQALNRNLNLNQNRAALVAKVGGDRVPEVADEGDPANGGHKNS